MVPHPILGLFSARFQWRGAESHIHGSRDNISLSPEGGPEAGGNYFVETDADSPRHPSLLDAIAHWGYGGG